MSSRRELLCAGLRRLAALLGGLVVVTGLGGLAVGAVSGGDLARAVSVAYYGVGSLALAAGFLVGSRGPVRARVRDGRWLPAGRELRWAGREEQKEAISLSALIVTAGLLLVLVGLAVDPRANLL